VSQKKTGEWRGEKDIRRGGSPDAQQASLTENMRKTRPLHSSAGHGLRVGSGKGFEERQRTMSGGFDTFGEGRNIFLHGLADMRGELTSGESYKRRMKQSEIKEARSF